MSNSTDATLPVVLLQAIDAVARAQSETREMFSCLELISQDLRRAEVSLASYHRALKQFGDGTENAPLHLGDTTMRERDLYGKRDGVDTVARPQEQP